MRINIRKVFIAAFSAVFVVFAQTPAKVDAAKSLTELQNERKQLSQNSENAKKELENLKNKKATVQEELDALDKVMQTAQAELDKAQSDLNEVTARLNLSKEELAQAEIDQENQLNMFGKRIKFMHENGSVGYVEVILESDNMADVLARMQYIQDIINYDNKILENLKENKILIEKKTKDIEQEQIEAEHLLIEQKEKTDAVESARQEKQNIMNAYEQDEDKYNQLIESNEKASKEVEKLINEAMAKAAASQGGSGYVYTGGKLNWPVPARAASSSSLSSGFVSRNRPIGSGTEFHTGYDIPAPYGSNIVAAEAGTVIYSGWMNGYGNTIMINHGGGLVTLYGHNSSLVVSNGASVTRGQVVAKCGSTGNSTGNHCHFEVRLNGKYVSPEPYLGVPNISR